MLWPMPHNNAQPLLLRIGVHNAMAEIENVSARNYDATVVQVGVRLFWEKSYVMPA